MGNNRKTNVRRRKERETSVENIVEGLAYALKYGLIHFPKCIYHYTHCVYDAFDNDFTGIDQAIKNLQKHMQNRTPFGGEPNELVKWQNGMKDSYAAKLYILKMFRQLLGEYYEVVPTGSNKLSKILAWNNSVKRRATARYGRETSCHDI